MTEALDIARRRFTAKVYDPAKSVTDAEWKDLLEILRQLSAGAVFCC